jgi:hypothetical protein
MEIRASLKRPTLSHLQSRRLEQFWQLLEARHAQVNPLSWPSASLRVSPTRARAKPHQTLCTPIQKKG